MKVSTRTAKSSQSWRPRLVECGPPPPPPPPPPLSPAPPAIGSVFGTQGCLVLRVQGAQLHCSLPPHLGDAVRKAAELACRVSIGAEAAGILSQDWRSEHAGLQSADFNRPACSGMAARQPGRTQGAGAVESVRYASRSLVGWRHQAQARRSRHAQLRRRMCSAAATV
jgi:hypothetical protein